MEFPGLQQYLSSQPLNNHQKEEPIFNPPFPLLTSFLHSRNISLIKFDFSHTKVGNKSLENNKTK